MIEFLFFVVLNFVVEISGMEEFVMNIVCVVVVDLNGMGFFCEILENVFISMIMNFFFLV